MENAIRAGCPSFTCTCSEPMVTTGYALENMMPARASGLATIRVNNGYMSTSCTEVIGPWLDAINIDLRSMDDAFYLRICGAGVEPVLDNLRQIFRSRIHPENSTPVSGPYGQPRHARSADRIHCAGSRP
ncbi:MAG TPA: hypothetical protein VN371_10435 [Chlorobaculum sp.]|nr:hypothetical protein [Chlorobaculum sp.]